jgi:hypothetical protein
MSDVDYLYEPAGAELHWDGLKEKSVPQAQDASLSGPTPQYHHSERTGLAGTQMAAAAKAPPELKPMPPQPHDKPMTHEQLMAKAQAMLDDQRAQHEALLAAGPSLSERDDSGRQLPAWLTAEMRRQ